jgi:hypothetical protein
VITGEIELTKVRDDKPITTCRVSVRRDDGAVAVAGTAVTYTMRPPAIA